MPFSDDPVAGEYLVRRAIKSPNYQPGSEGWAINADGSAEFNQITVNGGQVLINDSNGDSVASIDGQGVASFQDLYVTQSPTFYGLDLANDIIDPLPKGLLAYGESNVVPAGTTSEIGIIELAVDLSSATSTRMLELRGNFWASCNVAAGSCGVGIRVRYTNDGTSPTTSSTLLYSANRINGANGIGEYFEASATAPFTPAQYRFLLSVARLSGSGTITLSPSTTQKTQFRVIDSGRFIPNTAVTNAGGGGTTPVQQYTKDYAATWTRSYKGDNTPGSFSSSTSAYQGNIGDANGNRRSMIGFDYATIQADTAGATINSCTLTLNFLHWYYNAGGTAVIGTHNSATASPGTWSGTSNLIQSGSWPKPGQRTVNLGTSIGNAFRDNTAKGIVLGPGQGGDPLTYYGYASGAGQANGPVLRIVYTK